MREVLKDADQKGVAIGHFNISELGALKAVAEVAKELKVPVIIGTSEGEREFLDLHDAVALVRDLRENHRQEIYLNADHTKSFEKIKEAVDAGYDAVLFDGAALPMDENIRVTQAVVQYVKTVNREILVEGEIGNIGSGSTIRKALPQGAAIKPGDLTKPEEAKKFVQATGVDLLAPAVGNVHGIIKGGNPKLDIKRIKDIRKVVGTPLVLHGGSGISDDDFKKAIEAGISVIHINTELRIAWRKGMEEGLKDNPEEIAPYKVLPEAVAEIKEVVYNRLKLFNRL